MTLIALLVLVLAARVAESGASSRVRGLSRAARRLRDGSAVWAAITLCDAFYVLDRLAGTDGRLIAPAHRLLTRVLSYTDRSS